MEHSGIRGQWSFRRETPRVSRKPVIGRRFAPIRWLNAGCGDGSEMGA
jgi:hypothetical protein